MMKEVISKLNDGGPAITYVIVILLFVIIGLFVKSMISDNGSNPKLKSLIASIAWFALAWGYLGRTFGLIMAFDKIAAAGDITPQLLAGGLKMALVGPLVALITFAIARILIIVLTIIEKKQEVEG